MDDGRDRREQAFGRLHRRQPLEVLRERRHVNEPEHVGVGALDFVGCFAAMTCGRGEPQVVVRTGSDGDRSGGSLQRDRIGP